MHRSTHNAHNLTLVVHCGSQYSQVMLLQHMSNHIMQSQLPQPARDLACLTVPCWPYLTMGGQCACFWHTQRAAQSVLVSWLAPLCCSPPGLLFQCPGTPAAHPGSRSRAQPAVTAATAAVHVSTLPRPSAAPPAHPPSKQGIPALHWVATTSTSRPEPHAMVLQRAASL